MPRGTASGRQKEDGGRGLKEGRLVGTRELEEYCGGESGQVGQKVGIECARAQRP